MKPLWTKLSLQVRTQSEPSRFLQIMSKVFTPASAKPTNMAVFTPVSVVTCGTTKAMINLRRTSAGVCVSRDIFPRRHRVFCGFLCHWSRSALSAASGPFTPAGRPTHLHLAHPTSPLPADPAAMRLTR